MGAPLGSVQLCACVAEGAAGGMRRTGGDGGRGRGVRELDPFPSCRPFEPNPSPSTTGPTLRLPPSSSPPKAPVKGAAGIWALLTR
jgi:hypothetical protein